VAGSAASDRAAATPGDSVPETVHALVPLTHVASLPRPIAFYRTLGISVKNTFTPPDQTEPTWAWLEPRGASLMLARAGEPIDARAQAILFYLYCPHVAAMKAALEAANVPTGPMTHPFYAPEGQFRITDPDGYALIIMQG
jgi:hypothetical protein